MVTRTINQLHFEDLDPIRFEELILAMVYRMRRWDKLDHFGKKGSDDGIDIRAVEQLENGKDNTYYIQCKRYKKVTNSILKEIVDDYISKNNFMPQFYILVVSCAVTKKQIEYWEKYCNSYRCNIDSLGDWDNFLKIYKSYFDFIDYINKGHYFDLDMLDLGQCDVFTNDYNKPNYGFTEDEQIVVYTLRAITSSPIQISTNFKAFNEFELSIYCNEEVIAINQDCGTYAAKPYMLIENGKKVVHVLKKKLHGGDYAIAVFNIGETIEDVKIYLDEISEIRDLWAKQNLDVTETIVLTEMPPHTTRMFRVKPNKQKGLQ